MHTVADKNNWLGGRVKSRRQSDAGEMFKLRTRKSKGGRHCGLSQGLTGAIGSVFLPLVKLPRHQRDFRPLSPL